VKAFAVFVLFVAALHPIYADTLVISGGVVTEIKDLVIDGTPYNVTFGSTDDMTFAFNPGLAGVAAAEIATALGSFPIVSPFTIETDLWSYFIDRGDGTSVGYTLDTNPVFSPHIWLLNFFPEPTDDAKSLAQSPGFYFAEFTNLEPTPEPAASYLLLTALSLLGLMRWAQVSLRKLSRH
jgi:hypothetical protein